MLKALSRLAYTLTYCLTYTSFFLTLVSFFFFFFFGEGNGTPLQYSCLENPMDGGAWWAAVHRVAKSRTRLSDFTFTFHFHALEKEMATHSSVLAWRIPGTGEPDGLPSMGSHRVGHDWSDLAAAAAATSCEELTHWKRLWCWEGLGEGGKGDDRGWDGWMASQNLWTWVWVNSGSWWWTGRPGMLRFMGLQRVGHDWATDLSVAFVEFLLKEDP